MTFGWAGVHHGLIHQIGGLSFFVLGVAAWLATRRTGGSGLDSHMGFLAAFGLAQGIQWFVEGERLDNPLVWLAVLSIVLMIASFASLLEFGRRLWNQQQDIRQLGAVPLYAVLALGTAVLALSAPTALAGMEMGARYLLGAPAGVLAGTGLFIHSRAIHPSQHLVSGLWWLRLTALAMLASAALIPFPSPESGELVVAWVPTPEAFPLVTGEVVSVARTLCAVVLAAGFTLFIRKEADQDSILLGRVTDQLDGFVYRCNNSPDWPVTFMSEGGERLTGYSAQAFLEGEVHFADLIHPGDRDRVWVQVQEALAEQRDFRLEYRMIHRTGTVRWCYEEGRGVFGPEGGLLYLEGLVRNDDERHKALSEQRRMQQLVEASPQPIGWADLEGKILYLNQAFRMMLGMPRDAKASDYQIQDFYDDQGYEALDSNVRPTMIKDGAWTGEMTIQTLDGRDVPTLHSVFALRDMEGEISAVANVLIDLGELREAEQELRVIGAALETSINGIALAGMDGVVTYVNQAFADLWRLSGPEDAVGRSALDFAQQPEDVQAIMDSLRRIGSWTGTLAARRADGSSMDVELRGHTVLDEDGEPLCMMASFVDVTARVRMAEQLRRSTEGLKEAQRLARVGSWELNLAEGKLTWSDEIFRIFELDPDDFEPSYEAFLAAIHPHDRKLVDEAYRGSVASGTPYSVDHRLLMQDGRVKWVREEAETIYGEDGVPLMSRGTIQDITHQKQTTLQLEKALREKEVLVREVNHRVKNNLQVMSSVLHLKARKASNAEVESSLDEARQPIAAMDLVHEHLYRATDLSRIAFHEYLSSLVDQIGQVHSVEARGIRLPVDVTPCRLSVDQAVPLGMIVNELVGNALKHAFPGLQKGRICTTVTRGREFFTLTVADDGIGLPDSHCLEDGSSFGWQLIPALVRQIGGELRFGAGPDGGFSASVTFPLDEKP
jgi:PAS domain S-box-containing protein